MHLASESPANRGVLEYLTRHQRGRNAPPIEPWNAGSGSTWQLGSHPDVVEHLWEVVAARLPSAVTYTVRSLGTLGGNFFQAFGINDGNIVIGASHIVGSAETHALVWKNGS